MHLKMCVPSHFLGKVVREMCQNDPFAEISGAKAEESTDETAAVRYSSHQTTTTRPVSVLLLFSSKADEMKAQPALHCPSLSPKKNKKGGLVTYPHRDLRDI